MSRAERLLDLMQQLRHHRQPVSGAVLAETLGISLRTLYRDIASLQSQGAHIDGEPGLGYVLRPGFTLPPLMFTADEVEALALGSRWVVDRALHVDAPLALAAKNALAKIASVLPAELRHELDTSALLVAPAEPRGRSPETSAVGTPYLTAIRRALRAERKLHIGYKDLHDQTTERTIWPVALGYFEAVRVLVAWCEMRQGFRHFRADRLAGLTELVARLPKRREVLFQEWQRAQGRAARKG